MLLYHFIISWTWYGNVVVIILVSNICITFAFENNIHLLPLHLSTITMIVTICCIIFLIRLFSKTRKMPKHLNNVTVKITKKQKKKITMLPIIILFGKYFVILQLKYNSLTQYVYEN